MTKHDESVDDLKKKIKRLQVLSIGGWISSGVLAISLIMVIIILSNKIRLEKRVTFNLKSP